MTKGVEAEHEVKVKDLSIFCKTVVPKFQLNEEEYGGRWRDGWEKKMIIDFKTKSISTVYKDPEYYAFDSDCRESKP